MASRMAGGIFSITLRQSESLFVFSISLFYSHQNFTLYQSSIIIELKFVITLIEIKLKGQSTIQIPLDAEYTVQSTIWFGVCACPRVFIWSSDFSSCCFFPSSMLVWAESKPILYHNWWGWIFNECSIHFVKMWSMHTNSSCNKMSTHVHNPEFYRYTHTRMPTALPAPSISTTNRIFTTSKFNKTPCINCFGCVSLFSIPLPPCPCMLRHRYGINPSILP